MIDARKENVSIPGLTLRNTLQIEGKMFGRLAWSPDGKILASSCRDTEIQLWDINSGSVQHMLQGNFNYSLAWSPDGTMLAASGNFSLFLWDTKTGKLYTRLKLPKKTNKSIAWSPDGTILATGSEDNIIRLWDPISQKILLIFQECSGPINSLAWSPNGQILASGSEDGTLCLWNPETGQPLWTVAEHLDEINGLVWSPDGRTLATASSDKTIRIWDIKEKRLSTIIESHTSSIVCIAASHDGRLLASKSLDGTVRLWQFDTGKMVANIDESTQSYGWYTGIAFEPNGLRLATLGEKDTIIRVWDIDIDATLGDTSITPSVQYRSAKVVLVGDQGVGKTSLSLVLTKQSYSPPESTHGRQVLLFDSYKAQLDNGYKETRETLLWDLAGQRHYRLIHQLHMNEVALSLIVFDAYNNLSPLEPINYWRRILKLAEHVRNDPGFSMQKFLVATHIDLLGKGFTQSSIDKIINSLGFDKCFVTSAKEGTGITELAGAIKAAIGWETLPKVSSIELFQKVKDFILVWKGHDRELSHLDDLYQAFLISQSQMIESDEVQVQFETCIDQIESQDLIKKLNYEGFVLLRPELLDYYASALVDAVLEERDGLGNIFEEKVINGDFNIPEKMRFKNRVKEKVLLLATISHLQQHEIIFREHTVKGPYLIFPSLATRELPHLINMGKNAVIFRFEGPVENIYATLAVSLSHSGSFKKHEIGKDAMTFAFSDGGFEERPEICGIFLSDVKESIGKLTLSFNKYASYDTRVLFEQYIHAHLTSHALPASVQREVIYECLSCAEVFSMETTKRRRKLGFDTITCNICETIVPIAEKASAQLQSQVSSIRIAASALRDKEIKQTTLKGISQAKKLRGEYDVFICYNYEDLIGVKRIKMELEDRGIAPWFDEEELQPGLPRLLSIEQHISKSKAVAVFIGKAGLGPWQQMEVDAFHEASVERKIPLIPVFLKTAPYESELPPFLKRIQPIDFRNTFSQPYQPKEYVLPLKKSEEDDRSAFSIMELNEEDDQEDNQNLFSLEDSDAYRDQNFEYRMDLLIWGITGKKVSI